MGSKKRKKKKLARQQNNAGGKHVPPFSPIANGKAVPSTATGEESYREKLVRWTVSELDDNSGIEGCRWELSSKETKELLTFLDTVSKKTWKECLTETVMSGKKNAPEIMIMMCLPSAKMPKRVSGSCQKPRNEYFDFGYLMRPGCGGLGQTICLGCCGTTPNTKSTRWTTTSNTKATATVSGVDTRPAGHVATS